MHHLDPRAGLSDRFSFRGLHGGALSGCYLQPPRLRRLASTGCPRSSRERGRDGVRGRRDVFAESATSLYDVFAELLARLIAR